MAQDQPIRTLVVDLAKLRDYCLNEAHPRGRHKARVFCSRLGLTSADAEWLQEMIATAAAERLEELHPTESDAFGDRYVLDIEVRFQERTANVRCAWIVRPGEEMIRLTTCYVL